LKRLVIHIGIEKTGTTSLQHYLYLNEALLAEKGIGLLHCVGSPNNRQVAHYADSSQTQAPRVLRKQLADGSLNWRQMLRQELHAEVKAMPAHIHSVVVSSEHLHSRLRSLEEVRQVAELFDGLFETTDIVVYLRRQDKLAVSLFSTALRGGWHEADPLPKLGAGRLKYYDFADLLSRWADVFNASHIKPRIFDRKSFINGDLYADFLSTCGWPELIGALAIPPAKNEALSAVAATALLHLNKSVSAFLDDNEPQACKKLRKTMADELTIQFPGSGLMPSRQQAEHFLADFAQSNLEVSRRWFNGVPIFDQDFSTYPHEALSLSLPTQALTVLMQTLVEYMRLVHVGRKGADLGASLGDISNDETNVRLLRKMAQKLRPILPTLAERLQEIARSLRKP